jgi:hypothetical protein
MASEEGVGENVRYAPLAVKRLGAAGFVLPAYTYCISSFDPDYIP